MNVMPQKGDHAANVPTRMEPSFSLAFFRRCQDGAVILNADGRVGFMNDAARTSLGITEISDVHGRQWTALWPEDAAGQLTAAIDRVRKGEAVRLDGLDAPSGTLDLLASPVMNKEGKVESIFLVMFPTGSTPRISG